MAGVFTSHEIHSQPEAWSAALQYLREQDANLAVLREDIDEVIFTGCGSTWYLSLAAAAQFQELTGVRARGVPASELWLYPRSALSRTGRTLLVPVSRSGATTETIRAVQRFRDANDDAQVLTLSCYPDAELAGLGDTNLILEAGQERSVAQTRAFSVLYLAAVFVALRWAGQPLSQLDALPAACERLIQNLAPVLRKYAQDRSLDRFYFLGSGPRYGLACEASLKMKEMSLSHSEPFHFLEFRHGPQSMVTGSTLLVGLLSVVNGDSERAVLEQMQQRGAQILGIAAHDAAVELDSGIAEHVRNVLYLPALQLLALERAHTNGLDPDRPLNLTSVVTLD